MSSNLFNLIGYNKLKVFKNKKTGNYYRVITEDGKDVTNERDGLKVVIYQNHHYLDKFYVREAKEFYEKFEFVQNM